MTASVTCEECELIISRFSSYGPADSWWTFPQIRLARAYLALLAEKDRALSELAEARKDTERLQEVEDRGLTIEHRGGITKSVDPWMVREATSTHKALTYWTGKTAREAIDAARAAATTGADKE